MATTRSSQKVAFADSKDTYQAALLSLFSGKPEETEGDLSKLFTPTFSFRANDLTLDFDGFVKHIRWLRDILPSVELTIVQFVRDGNQLAERHTSETTKPDGTIGKAETFQFGQVAEDGRIAWIVESVYRHKN
jgi:hypothetical protein